MFLGILFAALALTGIVAVLLGKVVMLGRKTSHHPYLMGKHKQAVDTFAKLTLVDVVLVELLVRMSGGRWGDNTLFLVHISFVVAVVTTFVCMRFKWTGKENPVVHRKLAALFLACFVAMTATGAVLMSNIKIPS